MSMKTSTRQVNGVTIVDCSGRITLGEGSVILKDVVRELCRRGRPGIDADQQVERRQRFCGFLLIGP